MAELAVQAAVRCTAGGNEGLERLRLCINRPASTSTAASAYDTTQGGQRTVQQLRHLPWPVDEEARP